MLSTHDLKFSFFGHILIQQPVWFGLWKRQRQIEMVLSFDHIEESNGCTWETSAHANFYLRKRRIHYGLEATAEIHATEGRIIINARTQNGQWTFSGTLYHDPRRISGTVDMENLDYDGIRGTFLQTPFQAIAERSISGAFLFDGIREDLYNDVKDLYHNGYEALYASLLAELESLGERPDLLGNDRLNAIMKQYRKRGCDPNLWHELISAAVDELKVLAKR
jgi:hypothetical protein